MAEAPTRALARSNPNAPAPVSAHRSNLISLSEEVLRVSPFHVVKTKQVKLNPDPRGGDVYAADFIEKGMLAPAKNGLLKMIRACGAVLAPELCRYTISNGLVYGPLGTPPTYIEQMRNVWAYQAVLVWAGSDGRPMPAIGSKEVDLRDDSEAVKQIRSDDRKAGWKQDKEISQLRQFGSLMAETKAILRAARQVLQIKQAFTREELAIPFEVQCLEYSPDLSDPEVRSIVITQGAQATAKLFGGTAPQAALPAPPEPEATPEAFPVDGPSGGWGDPDDYDPNTGEVAAADVEEAELVGAPSEELEEQLVSVLTNFAQAKTLEELNGLLEGAKKVEWSDEQRAEIRKGFAAHKKSLAA